ncbi:glycoside hydrolase family 15 protein [Beijerinckia sp. L45]|uniref:glycoside hydrolase family 15 protein n=1 Tax=Beijerinckia sp. L45 TaxID=1641855 RepID=UPI00131EA26D|nr:glycoside hydrolase family 15 protein [Beijerinckia sp. L45]
MRSVALVSDTGTIDFLCHPRLDSPSVFCSILDPEAGGSFALAPSERKRWTSRQIYIPDTNVLVTRFMDGSAVVEVTDYMPITEEGPRSAVLRRVTCVRGSAAMAARCSPRFDYGRDGVPKVSLDGDAALFRPGTPTASGPLRLRSDMPMTKDGQGGATATFRLEEGQSACFILECGIEMPSGERAVEAFIEASFKETIAFWQEWSARSSYRGRWREHVSRSALVLKLLTSADHGSIAAAATFGLPEQPAGARNWDYRFCWIRDAAFTTFALMRLGYVDEARRFNAWVSGRAERSEAGDLQILYRLDGGEGADETELLHMPGYGGARPVRIGNAAAGQLQLDIYGALFDSVYIADRHGLPVTYEGWEHLSRALDWLCTNWDRPDEGIWEIRGERRHFLSSRLMCWVALDRGLRLARKRSLPAENAAEWERNRDLIHRDIQRSFWNDERNAFVQYKGGSALDASVLLMPLMKFIAPGDPRWLSTLAAVERELVSDVLVRRYETDDDGSVDGLAGAEGAFTPCCFWFVECLARSGDVHRARLHFEKLVGYANGVGLFSEEISVGGAQLGNTPQALTHLALISAAYTLDLELDRSGAPARRWRSYQA